MTTAYQIALLRADAEEAEAKSHDIWAEAYKLEADSERVTMHKSFAVSCRERADGYRIDARKAFVGTDLAQAGNQQQ